MSFSSLQLEVEARLHEPPVVPAVDPVQPCGAVRHVRLHFVGFNQRIHRQHALAKVAFVELAFEDQFSEMLEDATARNFFGNVSTSH
jgi:hypothetical protein